ncbi:hypothetical protein B0A50_02761 [Salinomyces thailandicus]|uniref:Major facilitator superfamily (MFS) profile domain-containing protein n=1 Tax=Salinomyces thailandicus TaxID=706561 RepID=A0A4U0U610_9PEZI|nr:hypothetical protein B0A50_02761 [Salinomyces thailandica]
MEIPKIYNTYFVALVATIGGMLFGFDISSMSAIIGTDQYNDFFNTPAGIRQGAIGSALAAGSVVGSLIAGPISNWIGRRNSIGFACIWWLAGTAVQTSVNGFGMPISGRVLNGIWVGITSSQVPVYLAEIARKEKRGALIIVQQLAIEWGILIMYFSGYGCSFIKGPASFRTAWGVQFVPALFLIAGFPFLPESTRWLAKKDRADEAIQILARIQAGGDTNNPFVVAGWEEITMTLQAERSALPGWKKFVYNGMWKRTLAGFTVQMWQQNAGANYVVYIFSMAGLSGNLNLVASGVQYALFIVFTTIMFFYVDKVGRRPLLVFGALGMVFCHFVVGGLLSAGRIVPGGVDGNPNVPIELTGPKANTMIAFCYLLIISCGYGNAAEGNWLFNWALGLYIPPGFINIHYGLFIVFGVMRCLAAIQFYFTYPETCGKTLEEIEESFATGGPKPWHTRMGHSRLDALVDETKREQLTISDVIQGKRHLGVQESTDQAQTEG